jgi:hypothetical protein
MGNCTYLHARLLGYRIRRTCGEPVYTRLRMKLPGHRVYGERFSASQQRFKLPACGGPFRYI